MKNIDSVKCYDRENFGNYKPLLTKPNLKHLKDSEEVLIYGFSIPYIKTCIGATKKCIKYCMIAKGNFKIYPNIYQGYEQRYLYTLEDNFIDRMGYEIDNRKVNKKRIEFIRLHISGDFYSEEYKQKWFILMQANKDVKFLFYTKALCFNFDMFRALKNVGVIQSFDTKFSSKLNPDYSIAKVFKTRDMIPENYVDCTNSDYLAFKTARENKNIALIKK